MEQQLVAVIYEVQFGVGCAALPGHARAAKCLPVGGDARSTPSRQGIIMRSMNNSYTAVEPTRNEIDSLEGPAVVEFGAAWCSYCRAAQRLIAAAFAPYQPVRHIKVEDGKGRPLGRSFRVTLWPTLIFIKNGREIARLVRPDNSAEIGEALRKISDAD